MSAELPAGKRRHGNSRSATGIPTAGQPERKEELPQIWPGSLLALPWAPSSLAGQRGRAGPRARTNGKRKGSCKDDPGYPGPQTKEMGFARDARGACGTQSGDAVPCLEEMARAPGNTHAGAGRRGGRERAGSHAAGRRGTHAQSRTSPGGRGTRRREAGAGALTQPPGLERARRLQHRSAPGPCRSRSSMCRGSPAVAAAPLQQRQQQRPPWPSPARSSPASCKVRGCGGLRDARSGSVRDPVRSSPRYTPAAVPPAPAPPLPMPPACQAAPSPAPASQRRASVPGDPPLTPPRLTLSGPSCPRAARADLW